MMIPIVIPEDMLMCFKQCARLRDYTMFVEEYQSLVNVISEYLKSASFPRYFECNFLSMHLKLILRFLMKWDPRDDFNFSEHAYLQRHVPEMCNDMKYCISTGSWSGFYWKYRDQIDYMIMKSRDQRVIDFRIECLEDCFESFQARDSAFKFKMSTDDYLPSYQPTVICTIDSNERVTLRNPEPKRENRCHNFKNLKPSEMKTVTKNVTVRITSSINVPVASSLPCRCIATNPSAMVLDIIAGSCGIGTMETSRDRCQYSPGMGITTKIVRNIIQKGKDEQKLYFEQKMIELENYKKDWQEMIEFAVKIFQSSDDNETPDPLVEEARQILAGVKITIEKKQLELQAELERRQKGFDMELEEILKIMYPASQIHIVRQTSSLSVNLDNDVSIRITSSSGRTWTMFENKSSCKPTTSSIDLNLVWEKLYPNQSRQSCSNSEDAGFHEMEDDRRDDSTTEPSCSENSCNCSIMDLVWDKIDAITLERNRTHTDEQETAE